VAQQLLQARNRQARIDQARRKRVPSAMR
jgi:hypothetical protein